jgi:hypothetical protein
MRSLIPSISWPLLAAMSVSASHPARGAPDAATPANGSTSPAPQPIEMREVFWGSRYGELLHKRVPFRGNLMLDDPALLRLLGREDLLRAYEERTSAREVLTVGGLLGLIGSGVAFAAARPKLDCSGTAGCRTDRSDGALAAGVVLLVLSAVLIVAEVSTNASPISDDERLRLIDQYNRSIKPQSDTPPR